VIRTIKLRRNIVFGGKLVIQRGEELTDIELGVRVRKHLVENRTAVQVVKENPQEGKALEAAPENKAMGASFKNKGGRKPKADGK